MSKREDIINIRAIAILLVVFGHSIIIYSEDWNVYSTTVDAPFFAYCKQIINMVQMPLFFSISGFCLLFTMNAGRQFHFMRFMFMKFKRIVIPFFFVAFFWLLPIRSFLHYPNYQNQNMLDIIFKDLLLGKDNGHLWFLPTLFIMMLVSGFIGVLFDFGWKRDFVLTLASIFFFALPHFMLNEHNIYLLQFCNYYVFFVLGFLIHRYERYLGKYPYIIAVFVFAASVFLSLVIHAGVFVLSAFCVVSLYRIVPSFSCDFLRLISKDSMGIYLFHSPMIYISFTYWPDINPGLMFFINFIIFGGIAVCITEFARFAHCGFIIGE